MHPAPYTPAIPAGSCACAGPVMSSRMSGSGVWGACSRMCGGRGHLRMCSGCRRQALEAGDRDVSCAMCLPDLPVSGRHTCGEPSCSCAVGSSGRHPSRRHTDDVQRLFRCSAKEALGAILSMGEAWCLFHGLTLSRRRGGALMERLLALLAETGDE